MQNSTGISTRELFFKKLRKHFPLFLELHILLGAAWCSGKLVRVSHYVAPMTRN